jgi:putative solute:sodium symporter small subunit
MASIPTDDQARRYWRHCLRITAALMSMGFIVTFGVAYFARELNASVFGWPFSFWMASQGALIVYLALVCVYVFMMRRLDARCGVTEDD